MQIYQSMPDDAIRKRLTPLMQLLDLRTHCYPAPPKPQASALSRK